MHFFPFEAIELLVVVSEKGDNFECRPCLGLLNIQRSNLLPQISMSITSFP